MRDLDGLHDAAEFNLFVAPIELAGLAQGQTPVNEGLRQGGAGFGSLPALHIPLFYTLVLPIV